MKLTQRITRELSARAFWGVLELAEAVAFRAAAELGLSRAMVAEAFAAKAEEIGFHWSCDACAEKDARIAKLETELQDAEERSRDEAEAVADVMSAMAREDE